MNSRRRWNAPTCPQPMVFRKVNSIVNIMWALAGPLQISYVIFARPLQKEVVYGFISFQMGFSAKMAH